jgi:toxin ParE1/3/4
MKFKVVIDAAARDDLHSIASYLNDRNEQVANRFVASALTSIDNLLEMHGKGSLKRLRTAKGRTLRSWRVLGFDKYVIYNFVEGDLIIVVAVLHEARNVGRILKDR